ncbi:MAG: AAA family ATPase, partial [Lachnospiraceae bacterium]|nr:AAA family ATPase [Lachnospiraceae bacterium]
MPKSKTVFYCTSCGYESSKWMGQCPGCREWNTFTEEPVRSDKAGGKRASVTNNKPVLLKEVSADEAERFSTGLPELDRVLGGGIVKGSLVLIGGDPGIGKSTLLLQVTRNLSLSDKKVLYVSGEESLRQIKMRADRLGSDYKDMLLLCETDLDDIETSILEIKPDVVVIDSIQTMYRGD